MCFWRERWVAWRAGAAVESGRMFPVLLSIGGYSTVTGWSYAQPKFHDRAASPDASLNCLYVVGVRALAARLEGT